MDGRMRARIYRIYVVPFALAKVVNERDGVYNVHTPVQKYRDTYCFV